MGLAGFALEAAPALLEAPRLAFSRMVSMWAWRRVAEGLAPAADAGLAAATAPSACGGATAAASTTSTATGCSTQGALSSEHVECAQYQINGLMGLTMMQCTVAKAQQLRSEQGAHLLQEGQLLGLALSQQVLTQQEMPPPHRGRRPRRRPPGLTARGSAPQTCSLRTGAVESPLLST